MSKKTQYSSEYKTMLLSRFHESGMPTSEFANSEGNKQTTLNYWLKKESEFAIAINSKPENRTNLIDVTNQTLFLFHKMVGFRLARWEFLMNKNYSPMRL